MAKHNWIINEYRKINHLRCERCGKSVEVSIGDKRKERYYLYVEDCDEVIAEKMVRRLRGCERPQSPANQLLTKLKMFLTLNGDWESK